MVRRQSSQFVPSPDAKWLAYAVAKGGADWETVRVRNVTTGEDLDDEVAWVRFSELSWTHDSQGFFYSRYPEPPKHKVLEAALSGQAVYYHRLGTPQSGDQLIYQRTDHPSWIVNATVSDDGRYVFLTTYRGSDNNNQLHFIDLAYPGTPRISSTIQPIVETLDAEFTPIGNYQSRLYVRSDKDAPNRRVIAIDLEDPNPASWKVVVAELVESHRTRAGDWRYVWSFMTRVDVRSRLQVFGLDGSVDSEIALPGVGSIADIYGRSDLFELWFAFGSPLLPCTGVSLRPRNAWSHRFRGAVGADRSRAV